MIPKDTIGAIYTLETFNTEKARGYADALAAELRRRGINVCDTRKEWEGELYDGP